MRHYLAIALSLLLCGTAMADTITLKDGKVIEGKIVAESGDTVMVKLADGKMRALPRSSIAKIEKRMVQLKPSSKPLKCKVCRDVGTAKCSMCDGTGQTTIACTACEKGNIYCRACKGKWPEDCADCGERDRKWRETRPNRGPRENNSPGQNPPSWKNCGRCGGEGRIRCKVCSGKRFSKCRTCGGTMLAPSGKPCPKCKGTKVIPCSHCPNSVESMAKRAARIGKLEKRLHALEAELTKFTAAGQHIAMSKEDRAAIEALRDRLKGDRGYEVYCSMVKAERDLVDRAPILRELIAELGFVKRRAREDLLK